MSLAPIDVHCNGHITEGIYQLTVLSIKPADTRQCKETLCLSWIALFLQHSN